MENKKYKILRIIITGALSVLLLIPSCLWGTRPLYAEGEAPTKQTLGNMLITLLASFGVKTYIGLANSAQWVADNYEQFISTVSGLKSAYQIYEEVESTYDPSTGKSTLSADAYNSIAQYVRNFMASYDVVDDSEAVLVGQYISSSGATYYDNTDSKLVWSNGSRNLYVKMESDCGRYTFINNGNGKATLWLVSKTQGCKMFWDDPVVGNNPTYSYTNTANSSITINNETFYTSESVDRNINATWLVGYNSIPSGSYGRQAAVYYTYGSLALDGNLSDNIYYQGDQSLNDMVSTTDQNAVFDWSKVAGLDKTLAEILEAVNEIALSDAWDTVNFPVPDAKEPVPSVPVPDNTPIPPWWDNIPELEAPTCPTLSACIVSGARAVSDNITSLMNLHSELAIYTGVGLSLGLALLIIGAFRR